MLQHLPDKNDISLGQIVLGEVQRAEFDIEIAEPLSIVIDHAAHDVTGDVVPAERSDERTHGEDAEAEIDRVRLRWKQR